MRQKCFEVSFMIVGEDKVRFGHIAMIQARDYEHARKKAMGRVYYARRTYNLIYQIGSLREVTCE